MQEITVVKLNQYHPLRQRIPSTSFIGKIKISRHTVFQNSSFSLPWETNRQLSRKTSSKTIRFSILIIPRHLKHFVSSLFFD